MPRPALHPSGPQVRRSLRAAPDTWAHFDALRARLGYSEAEVIRQAVIALEARLEVPREK